MSMPEQMLPIVVLSRYTQDPEHAEYVSRSWSMSNSERNELIFVCQHVGKNYDLFALKQMVATNAMTEQNVVNLLAAEERWEDYREFREWDRPDFPVTGLQVMKFFNIKPGPEVGAYLSQMRATWAASNFSMDSADLFMAMEQQERNLG